MPRSEQRDLPRPIQYLLDEEMPLATIIYALLCIPAYVWLEGPMGFAGTVPGSIVIASFVTGSLLLVPLIAWVLRSKFGIGVPQKIEREDSEIFGGSFKASEGETTEDN